MTSPFVKDLTRSRALLTHRVTHDTFIDGTDMVATPGGVTIREMVEESLQQVPYYPRGDERR